MRPSLTPFQVISPSCCAEHFYGECPCHPVSPALSRSVGANNYIPKLGTSPGSSLLPKPWFNPSQQVAALPQTPPSIVHSQDSVPCHEPNRAPLVVLQSWVLFCFVFSLLLILEKPSCSQELASLIKMNWTGTN